jgi:hypothetical protein
MRALDDDIRAVELRLARRRSGLGLLARDWAAALRDTLVSGRSLLGVAAFGFAVGEMLRPRGVPDARARRGGRSARAGGALLALASFLLHARFGSPWQIAWAAMRAWRRQRPAGAPVAARAPFYRD